MKKLLLLCSISVCAFAQSQIYGNRVFNSGYLDASGATATRPLKTGTAASIPSTCNVGDLYFETDATAGKNLYACTSANTWVQASGGNAAGVNEQTASYTIVSSDSGKLVVMNCSAACTLSMPTAPSNGFYTTLVTIGSSVPTISLSGKQFNGSTSTPVLISFLPWSFWSDGSNFFGKAPPVAGSNINFATSASAFTISATSSGGSGWTSGPLSGIPSTCTVGQAYFATDQPANQQLYTCSATNTWTKNMLLGGSGAMQVTSGGALDINPAVVPQLGTPDIYTALQTFQAGLNLLTTNTQPTCASGTRGYLWFLNGGSGADSFEVCEYNGTAYAWISGGGSGGSGTVNSGTTGQFAYYSASGTTVGGHTLASADITTALGFTPQNAADANTNNAAIGACTSGEFATATTTTGLTCATPSGSGFTGTAGSVPFVGSGGSLTQDNANLFWDDAHHVLSLGDASTSILSSHNMDTGIALYANGNNYGRGGLLLTGSSGGAYAFSTSSYNSNFCFSSNNFSSCLIAVNPSISSSNLYFDATSSSGANAAFSILAGSEGGHIYTHGTAPNIIGTNCYPGRNSANTTANVTASSTTMTVTSGTGIAAGQAVVDTTGDLAAGTTVVSVSGTTVTLSTAAVTTNTSDTVYFITSTIDNDLDGSIATTGSTSCTIQFNTPWASAPFPQFTGAGTTVQAIWATSVSTAAVTVEQNASFPVTIYYHMHATD